MNTPETAPKDKLILLDVGLPWLVFGKWSQSMKEFVYAELHISDYCGQQDPYFESEWEKPEKIRGWLPLPDKT